MRTAAARGVAWTTLEALGSRLISTVIFFVLARLLVPEDFGLVALSLVFVQLARILVDQGFGLAIVQREELDEPHLDTAFWSTLAGGSLLAGVLALLAPPLAAALGSPELGPVLQALTLVVVVGAPSSTAAAVLRRGFGFRGLAQRRLLAAVAGGGAGVLAAVLGWGVWALVTQALVQAVVSTAVLWAVTPYRPRMRFSRRHFRELFTVGGRVIGITLLNFGSKRADDLLIGSVLGPVALGLYAVAYRLLTVMQEVLSTGVEDVAFSAFSRVQGERDRMRRSYISTLRLLLAVATPCFLTVAVTAPDLVLVLVGDAWAGSVPLMQVLALAGAAQAVTSLNSTVLLAAGRARTALRLSAAYAAANVAGFAIGVQFGVLAVAVAYTARAYVLSPVAVPIVLRELGMTLRSWLGATVPLLLTATVAAVAGLAVREALADGDPVLRLGAVVLASAVVHVALLRLLAPSILREGVHYLRALRRPPASPDRVASQGSSGEAAPDDSRVVPTSADPAARGAVAGRDTTGAA